MSNLQILQNDKLQHTLDTDGVVQVPFADANTVEQLKELCSNISAGKDLPQDILYTYVHNSDKELVAKMNVGIRNILAPLMDKVFVNYKNTSFTFQSKGLGEKSLLYAHQDWSFTDESKYRTYTFWLTLHDSYPENGTIYVLKGSHNKLNNIRGAGIEAVCKDVQPEAVASMEPVYIKAGELLVFDSALLHYSPPNTTPHIRISVMTNLAHTDAGFMLYFGHSQGNKVQIDGYKVSANFLMEYEDFKRDYNKPPLAATKVSTAIVPQLVFTQQSFTKFLNDIRKEDTWYGKLKSMLVP